MCLIWRSSEAASIGGVWHRGRSPMALIICHALRQAKRNLSTLGNSTFPNTPSFMAEIYSKTTRSHVWAASTASHCGVQLVTPPGWTLREH